MKMARIAIVGGKLQGTEAAYLAQKAGMESILIDHYEKSPAIGLCDEFLCCDVTQESKELLDALNSVDFILPANENPQVLDALAKLSQKYGFRLAFDPAAYAVSSSKVLSDKVIRENGIPAPQYYPNCKSPYIVKPSGYSGSEGVRKINHEEELIKFLKTALEEENWIAQEFLTGPSYSIEVIGQPGDYLTYEVTEIHMASDYDCKRVTAPCMITAEQEVSFRKIAVRLAELLQLKGIMDVEVIDDNGDFKVLEIDARIPSQTPTVVYHSTGINFVEELRDLFCGGAMVPKPTDKKQYCSYEHFLIKDGRFTEHGEHIMSQGGPLVLRKNFFGADEVISDFVRENLPWRGTFINWADTEAELEEKRENMKLSLLGL
jgi:pyrrolysine biosynthesis protein PylC